MCSEHWPVTNYRQPVKSVKQLELITKNMKQTKSFLYILLLNSFWPQIVRSGKTIPVKGETASGTGSAVTHTLGKFVLKVITGTATSLIQGVQQPFEISVITIIEKPEDINRECIVHQNPIEGTIRLIIKSFPDDNMSFRLYDMNGALLHDNKIEDKEIAITMEYSSTVNYLLKVLKDQTEIKVFKIVKK